MAVVQGGLTTCMELTAARRPFLYVPLREPLRAELPRRGIGSQRYGAGRCIRYAEASDPETLAGAIVVEAGRAVDYRPVETDGAARAAALLVELI